MENIAHEIKASRELLEQALQNSGVAISQQDLALYYTHFTNSHPGMAQENLVGKSDADWLPKKEADRLTAIKTRALDGKKGVREIFKSTLNGGKEGDIYYNDIRVEPIEEKGKVVGIYTIAIDVTAFHKALLRLQELNGRLLTYIEGQLKAP
jgi:PAS domain S-box-containing protein